MHRGTARRRCISKQRRTNSIAFAALFKALRLARRRRRCGLALSLLPTVVRPSLYDTIEVHAKQHAAWPTLFPMLF